MPSVWKNRLPEVIRLIEQEHATLNDIGKIYGCSRQRVCEVLKSHGYYIRTAYDKWHLQLSKQYKTKKFWLALRKAYGPSLTFQKIYELTGVNSYDVSRLEKRLGINIKSFTEEERFWHKVDKRSKYECWEWLACRDSMGYGRFSTDYRDPGCHVLEYAHRFSIYLHTGKKLETHEIVCHSCNNSSCVNPRHLKIATQKVNMEDRDLAGNTRSGKPGKSGYWGVQYCPGNGKYRASIYINPNKRQYLGYFISPEDAARAYNKAARAYNESHPERFPRRLNESVEVLQ